MKQTQNTHVCSLVREEAAAYSLARQKVAAVTWESGEAVLFGTRGKATAWQSLRWRWDQER